jgi:ketosteroid isomerase-like protein
VKSGTHSQGAAAQIRAAEHAWMEAMKRQDTEACRRFMAEDYILVSAQGAVVPLETWLENIRHMTFHSYAFGAMEIAVAGEVALVRAPWRQEATNRGEPWDLDGEITDVWVLREGRWLVAIRRARSRDGR